MNYDLIIRNGTLIDGTGAERRMADIAVSAGKVREIGRLSGASAKRVIDASHRVVAPGFVDPHTHYDAQLWWDNALTPSPWHGVTSVMMGNCGVGIAPCARAGREAAMQDLVNVEGIPLEVMQRGISWDWESFPQFVDAAGRRGAALNMAFIAPLTPFRFYVMGEAASERAATPEETARIRGLLEEAIDAGAFGFSTTQLVNHVGYLGKPLGCKLADRNELRAYANVLKRRGKGAIEIALTKQVSILSDEEYELLDFLLTESGAPVTWLAVVQRDDLPQACDDTLRKAAPLIRRGGIPQMMPQPLKREMDLRAPLTFSGFPSWHALFNKSVEEQIRIYGDPAFRDRFREELKRPAGFTGNWDLMRVVEVHNPALKRFEGWSIGEIARERARDGVDALLDLAIEDELRSEFTLALLNNDAKGVARLLTDDRTMIGLSDGGAHLSVFCDAGYSTYLLGTWVRERRVLSLERAVKRLTSEPADFFRIKDRGRLQEGCAADIVVFDPDAVGAAEHTEKRYDLPGGARRIVVGSRGIEYTIVNGVPVFEAGEMTGAHPGQVLRS